MPSVRAIASVELVPGHDVGAAELPRATRRARIVDDRREELSDVLEPDRLDALRSGADHGDDRREFHLFDERRQRAASAEDEARADEHVLEPGAPRTSRSIAHLAP